jgi:hypothetical protein
VIALNKIRAEGNLLLLRLYIDEVLAGRSAVIRDIVQLRIEGH